MKKAVLPLLILSLLLPSALWADRPEDQAVKEAASAVLNLFGLVLLSSLSTESPAGVTVDLSGRNGNPSMKFENFSVEPFAGSLSTLVKQIPFQTLNGTIDVSSEGDLKVDLKLTGGAVKKLEMASRGEEMILLKADGEDFPRLLPFFGAVSPSGQSIPE